MVRSELIVVAVLAMACGHERAAGPAELPAPTAAPPATGGGPSDDRGLAIARAACARVQRCGGIGPLGAFSSREECVAYLIETDIDPLGVAACREVDAAALESCVEALRTQDCEEVSTPVECLAPSLCAPRRER